MTDESEPRAIESPSTRPWNFGTGTLFVGLVIVALLLATFQQRRELRQIKSIATAHGLAASIAPLTANECRILVRELSRDGPAVYEIVIETLGNAQLNVTSGHNNSIVQSSSTLDRGGLTRSSVLIAVDAVAAKSDAETKCRYLIKVNGANGSSAGGPALYFLPPGKTIADVFKPQITSGIYQRGQTIPLCTFDGDESKLTVN